ncbi:hypothetical protein AB0J21_18215 [Streptomyces sp. NPDC049954]|uniref:hypothetical protein n=1 Tax=Streptomyces sp. NPDC049954 TaxID=3155779 RepID=UPI00341B4FF0
MPASSSSSPALPRPVVDFLDTSVLVEILDVPHMNAQRASVLAEMDRRLRARAVRPADGHRHRDG